MLLTLPPLSLYVHIPWCVRKCPYCDFNSHKADQQIPEQAYTASLLSDLKSHLEDIQGRRLRSIFFGGGTPSLFSPQTIGSIVEKAEQLIGFEPDIEITLEANPGTIEHGHFPDYAKAGINRVSLGVQSFNDQQLKTLGRIHSASGALHSIESVHRSGINNFNIDLMHGLPGQITEQALSDLQTALNCNPTHISWYQLTLEPNTVFYKRPPTLPDEDQLDSIQQQGMAFLLESGFRQYEVSAFSKAGSGLDYRARHNLNYWEFGDYIGIGAGAHSKLTNPAENSVVRQQKTRLPADYMNTTCGTPLQHKPVPTEDLPGEFFMNALRLKQGVPKMLLETRTGTSWQKTEPMWQKLEQQGLVEPASEKLRTTALGFQFLNSVVNAFFS